VHLYALSLVSSIDVRSSGGGIRSQLVLATVNARIRDDLCDAIEEILDGEQRAVEDEEMSVVETALDGTEQGEVERMLWGQWEVDGSGKMACGESTRAAATVLEFGKSPHCEEEYEMVERRPCSGCRQRHECTSTSDTGDTS
jgi:hypothetical protein